MIEEDRSLPRPGTGYFLLLSASTMSEQRTTPTGSYASLAPTPTGSEGFFFSQITRKPRPMLLWDKRQRKTTTFTSDQDILEVTKL